MCLSIDYQRGLHRQRTKYLKKIILANCGITVGNFHGKIFLHKLAAKGDCRKGALKKEAGKKKKRKIAKATRKKI